MTSANWNFPTSVRFGPGRASELPAMCEELGIERPLLVTDPGLAALPMTASIVGELAAAGLGVKVFSAIRPNPVEENVTQGVAMFRENGMDGVIALGGGSALDAGKIIAMMSGQDRPVWDFVDEGDNWKRVNPEGIAPVIAVPTTAGTGSEVGRAGILTDIGTHEKKIIFHPGMMPKIALLDPQLTVGLPAGLTAATGMDALSHSLEAFCAPGYHPMADGIAVEGIRLVKENLPVAVRERLAGAGWRLRRRARLDSRPAPRRWKPDPLRREGISRNRHPRAERRPLTGGARSRLHGRPGATPAAHLMYRGPSAARSSRARPRRFPGVPARRPHWPPESRAASRSRGSRHRSARPRNPAVPAGSSWRR